VFGFAVRGVPEVGGAVFQMIRALVCDGCFRYERAPEKVEIKKGERTPLPDGWERVKLKGWVGSFHVCSDSCVTLLTDRIKPSNG